MRRSGNSMFCPKCGAPAEGKFCEKCSAAVQAGGGGSTGGFSMGNNAGSSAPPVFTAPGLTMNIVGALCYIIPVVCPIIFLLVDPYKTDRTVRFAAFQSLFFSVASFIANKLVWLLLGSSSWQLASNLSGLLGLAELALVLFLAFKAFQNEKIVLPLIGPLAQKQV